MWSPCFGAHGLIGRSTYTAPSRTACTTGVRQRRDGRRSADPSTVRSATVTSDLSQCATRFGVASEGQGAPRSRQSGAAEGHSATGRHLASSLRARRRDRRPPAPDAPIAPYRGRPSRRAPRRPRRQAARPSASASSPHSRPPSTSRSSEKVDVFLIAGDLFDSNTQPRRSVERVAAELAAPRPGEDPDASSSPAPTTSTTARRSTAPTTWRRSPARGPTTTSSRSSPPTSPSVHLPTLRRRSSTPGLRDEARAAQPAPRPPGRPATSAATWHVGMVHGALAIPDRTDRDEVVVTREEIAATGPRLPRARPLALDPAGQGRRDDLRLLRRARSRSPSTRTAPARSSSSTLDEAAGGRRVTVEERRSAGRRFEKLDVDAATRRRPAGPRRDARGEGRSRPRPRRPPDRRPARRARHRRRRGRGPAARAASSRSASATRRCPP